MNGKSISDNNDRVTTTIIVVWFIISCLGYLYVVPEIIGGQYFRSAILWMVALVVVGPTISFLKNIFGDSFTKVSLAVVSFGSFFIATQADSSLVMVSGVAVSIASAFILLGLMEAFQLIREGFNELTGW